MVLELQIQSLIVSFVYGMFMGLVYNISYFALNNKRILVSILLSFLYFLILFSIYFVLLFIINSGIVHIYFVELLILGFVIGNKQTKKIRFELKKSN